MPETNPSKKIKITDARKVSGATGLPIQNPRTGEYDYEVVSNIVKAARDEGVDPYTALAVALQETGMGTQGENIGQVNWDVLKKNKERYDQYQEAIKGSRDAVYEDARSLAFMLKKSMDDADAAGYTQDKYDEAQRLQAYNGYGKIGANNDVGAKQLYGIDLTKNTIDMAQIPLYGKTIVDVRDNIIKNNPEINDIVSSYSLPPEETTNIHSEALPLKDGQYQYVFKNGDQVVGQIVAENPSFQTAAAKAAYLRTLYLKSKKQNQ